MAKTKTAAAKKPTQKAAPKKASATKVPVSREAEQLHDAVTVASSFRPLWPAVGPVEREVFLERYTELACGLRGERTNGAKVLADAVKWLPVMQVGFEKGGKDIRGYSARRGTFFHSLVLDLGHALESQRAAQDGNTVVQKQRERAEAAAGPLRDELGTVLEAALGPDDTTGRATLSEARANAHDTAGLAATLKSFAGLGSGLLDRKDDKSKVRCEEATLTADLVTRAAQLAADLETASQGKLKGRVSQADSAEVNAIEGRVTYEMRDAMQAFALARTTNKNVPKLVPGDGTRAVLNHKAKEPDPVVTPAPTPTPTPTP